MSYLYYLIPVFFLIIFSWSGIHVTLASTNFEVFKTDSSPYGIPYNEWIKKWLIWWFEIPWDKHPANSQLPGFSDPNGCSVMQNGNVWFLPDIIVADDKKTYNCDVPSGKSILLPVSITFCERNVNGPPGHLTTCGPFNTDSQLKESADNIRTPPGQMIITVNGTKVNIDEPPVKIDFFNVTFPENPIYLWDVEFQPGGIYKVVVTAHFVFLHNMSPGKYEIKLSVTDKLAGFGPFPINFPSREGSFVITVK